MPHPSPSIETPNRPRLDRPPILAIVGQHVEEAAHLRHVRSVLVRAPHVRLLQLARLDERIAAHLDGVAVAGDPGVTLAHQALERPGKGEVFVAAVRAIEDRNVDRLEKLLAIAQALPASRGGLVSAFGWVSPAALQGITTPLIASADPWRREVGFSACMLHRVDPGSMLAAALHDADPSLRARAWRTAAAAGRLDLVESCTAGIADDDPHAAFVAARAALHLGDRSESLAALERLALDPHVDPAVSLEALRSALKVVPSKRARSILTSLAKDPGRIRTLIRGVAIAGDPHDVPWLISQMAEAKLMRLAGEAFSFITGLDLAALDLERDPAAGNDFGPNDDPADDNVAMDEDDSLPWPDAAKIGAWWKANGARFPAGTRHFMGEVPTHAHCLAVLKTGFQRQRAAAAEYLTLLTPGTPLFNIAAPARRQQRLLGIDRPR